MNLIITNNNNLSKYVSHSCYLLNNRTDQHSKTYTLYLSTLMQTTLYCLTETYNRNFILYHRHNTNTRLEDPHPLLALASSETPNYCEIPQHNVISLCRKVTVTYKF